MAYSIANKFIYYAHPRTASKSMADLLVREYGAEQHGHHHSPNSPSHVPYTMCVIRNPYEVMLSWWLRTKRKLNFDVFIATHENPPHLELGKKLFWMAPYSGVHLRFENLEHDWAHFCQTVGIKHHCLPYLNTTEDKLWTTDWYYSPKAIQAVKDRFGEELEIYDYDEP